MTIFSLLVGCHAYRVEIQQGHIIEEKLLDQVDIGMSKNRIASLLGTPILIDAFSSNTWTYVYNKQEDNKIEKRRLILEFKDDKLISIQ
jgi:outer membrane protein assembly factor BamE